MVHHYMTYKEALLFALPQALPPLVLMVLMRQRMHLLSMWCGFLLTQMAAILGHAGWKVPLPKSLPFLKPSYHDFHQCVDPPLMCANEREPQPRELTRSNTLAGFSVDYSVNFGAIFEFTDALFGTLARPILASQAEIASRALGKAHDYAKSARTVHDFPRFP